MTAVIAASVAAAGLVAGLATAGVTGSSKVIPFVATYAGTATVKVTGTTADISAKGAGTAAVIGKGSMAGVGAGNTAGVGAEQPCVPFTGTGAMTGPKGKVLFKVLPGSSGCGDEEGNIFAVSGKAAVTKATGKLLKAKGTLKFTGTYDKGAGTFSVKFSGQLKK